MLTLITSLETVASRKVIENWTPKRVIRSFNRQWYHRRLIKRSSKELDQSLKMLKSRNQNFFHWQWDPRWKLLEGWITGTYLYIHREYQFKNFKDKNQKTCNPVIRTFLANRKDSKKRNLPSRNSWGKQINLEVNTTALRKQSHLDHSNWNPMQPRKITWRLHPVKSNTLLHYPSFPSSPKRKKSNLIKSATKVVGFSPLINPWLVTNTAKSCSASTINQFKRTINKLN